MNDAQELLDRFNAEADARLQDVFGPSRVMIKVHPQEKPEDTGVLFMLPCNCARLSARQAKAIGEELMRAGSCVDNYREAVRRDAAST